jgi:hypothetical protein
MRKHNIEKRIYKSQSGRDTTEQNYTIQEDFYLSSTDNAATWNLVSCRIIQ